MFRWFLDLQPGDEAFDPTTFPRDRRRLGTHALTATSFDAVVARAVHAGLCSEHFSAEVP